MHSDSIESTVPAGRNDFQEPQTGIPTPAANAAIIGLREVTTRKVANGFIVKIGCQTFVAKTWNEVSLGVAEYWKDPIAAERKFCAAGE
jgi:hypothetical protein